MMVVTQNHHMNFEAKLCEIELDKNLLRINFRQFFFLWISFIA